jgi:flagellar hook protein FlgE
MNALAIGASAALAATDRFAATAQRVAGGKADLPSEAVAQTSAKAAFSASLAVIKTSDAMTKRLLDIKV